MNNLEEFVDTLDIPYTGEMSSSDEYVYILKSSDDFSKVYNIISSDGRFSLSDESLANADKARFIFTDGEHEIRFLANFDKDIYKLIISWR